LADVHELADNFGVMVDEVMWRLGERVIIFTRFSKITLKETVEPAPEVKINIRNEWNSYHFH